VINREEINNQPKHTVYYMVNVGFLVNRRIGLKKEGKLQEELVSGYVMKCHKCIHIKFIYFKGSLKHVDY
jgi:hypothetical protein